MKKNNAYILTGAPGTGKTTLLLELAKHYKTIDEPAREVIAEQRMSNGNGIWQKDRELFIKLMLERSVLNFNNISETDTVFFDRGIPDCIAYADYGVVSAYGLFESAQNYLYNKKVFLLAPWKEIYQNDKERTMSFEEALKFHECIVRVYQKLNYSLVYLPNTTTAERLRFIMNEL